MIEKFLLILVKILTMLTGISCAALTVISLVTGQPALLTFSALFLTIFLGFFSYTDIKKWLNHQ